ncbi:MAG TPA: hypothetical protein VLK65_20290 [Vicinamibacteria bacterium]|nr:hypothetical protein [Vicinamibacteria bacterium]
MKRVVIAFAVATLSAGLTLAQATKSHDVAAEVVKTDTAAKSLTLKVEGKETTMPVEGDAVNQIKDLKAGDHVTATCRDEGTAHKAVTKVVKKT